MRVRDGICFSVFAARHHNCIKDFLPALYEIVADKGIETLIASINEKLKIRIDVLNLYMLCAYVNELIREQYVVLLKKPTKEALEELGELEEIVFKDKEGKIVSTSYDNLLKVCLESAIEYLRTKGEVIETAKIGRYDKIGSMVDKSIIKCQFAYYVAKFLSIAFPDANREHQGKKTIVSPLEQELILRLMGYFELGLKYDTVSTDNFRKLIIQYQNLKYPINDYILYLKHDDWGRKINWKNPELKLQKVSKEEEDIIWHNSNTLIGE